MMKGKGGVFLALGCCLVAAGCAATPSYTKTVTTLGEVDTSGLVCRRARPVGSSIPKTICTSQAAWDRQDAAEAQASERMRDAANRQTNVDQFGRSRN